jgi:hypothetical protein
MLLIEKELFEDLMKGIDSVDKKLSEMLNGHKTEATKNEMILFIDNVEEFLDLNGDKIGPFEKGQIANIPKEIAKILIEDRKAEVVYE